MLKYIRLRGVIMRLLRYSLDEVTKFDFLTEKEQKIIGDEKTFNDIKSMVTKK